MTCAPFDSVGRYLVSSESPKPDTEDDAYVVDVLAFTGKGQCSCADWVHRIGPALREEKEPARRFCKHLVIAREMFTDQIIARMLEAAIS
jgi:hypothetical protein